MLKLLSSLVVGTVVLVPIALILWNAHPALLGLALLALVVSILIKGFSSAPRS
jgi:hypothetical protein